MAYKLIRIVKVLAPLFLLVFVLIGDVVGYKSDEWKSDKWESCHCYLQPWQPWQSCSKTCGGGKQQRWRNVHQDVSAECPKNFTTCANNDMGWDYQSCNTTCYNGGTYVDTTKGKGGGYCACLEGTSGPCCGQLIAEGGVAAAAHGEEEDDGAGGIAGGAIAGVAILAMAGVTIWYFGIRRYKKKKREAEQAAAGEAVQA